VSHLNRELQVTLQSALREAIARRHAYLTVDHLLYALLHDARGEEVLRGCGADPRALKAALLRFFEQELEKVPGEGRVEPEQTLGFQRVLQAAFEHADNA
jgi:ATP-dependent Clp protease ATP-binding subunit ClpA